LRGPFTLRKQMLPFCLMSRSMVPFVEVAAHLHLWRWLIIPHHQKLNVSVMEMGISGSVGQL
jgi:hypothetical protein